MTELAEVRRYMESSGTHLGKVDSMLKFIPFLERLGKYGLKAPNEFR